MSFLYRFKDIIISRGLNYYHNNKVFEYKQIDSDVYQGIVEGSYDNTYNVQIDIKHPDNSLCDCPYALDGNKCKHMAALYFEVFPDDAEEYMQDYYYEEDDYFYDDEDDYDDDDYYSYSFIEPLYFDYCLEQYINRLSNKQRKDLLIDLLSKDKELTFDKYLRNDYKELIQDERFRYVEEINKQIKSIISDTNIYDRYTNLSVPLLTNNQKKYLDNCSDRNVVLPITDLFQEKILYCFDDNRYFIDYLKNHLYEYEVEEFTDDLISYFEELKRFGVINKAKANVLIAINEFNEYDRERYLAAEIIKYMKYKEYVRYLIDKADDKQKLYKEFKSNISEKYLKYKKELSDTYMMFYEITKNKEALELSNYYGFIYNHNLVDLDNLVLCDNFKDIYLPRLLDSNNDYVLKHTYEKLNMKKEMFSYLVENNDLNSLAYYGVFLDDLYHDELYKRYKEAFYDKLANSKNREDYKQACVYVRAIKLLKDGDSLYRQLVNELKNNERHCKRTALFDEMDKA